MDAVLGPSFYCPLKGIARIDFHSRFASGSLKEALRELLCACFDGCLIKLKKAGEAENLGEISMEIPPEVLLEVRCEMTSGNAIGEAVGEATGETIGESSIPLSSPAPDIR